mgnify:CR=1 FL=1
MANNPKYYIVEASALPEVFLKVAEAKRLLSTGEAATVNEATKLTGISRSAFYKYRDAVLPFQNMMIGRIITFQLLLQDETGILSTLLNLFGIEFDSRLYIGRDVFSDAAPIVMWTDNLSWVTDKGFYNAATKKFTPREGVTDIPDNYVKTIRAYVNNCKTYSKNVAASDYFATLPDIVR